jgi:hypothetical protein
MKSFRRFAKISFLSASGERTDNANRLNFARNRRSNNYRGGGAVFFLCRPPQATAVVLICSKVFHLNSAEILCAF